MSSEVSFCTQLHALRFLSSNHGPRLFRYYTCLSRIMPCIIGRRTFAVDYCGLQHIITMHCLLLLCQYHRTTCPSQYSDTTVLSLALSPLTGGTTHPGTLLPLPYTEKLFLRLSALVSDPSHSHIEAVPGRYLTHKDTLLQCCRKRH